VTGGKKDVEADKLQKSIYILLSHRKNDMAHSPFKKYSEKKHRQIVLKINCIEIKHV